MNLTSPPHNGPVIRQIIGVTNNRNSQRESGPNYAETGGTIGPCGSPGGKILSRIQNTKRIKLELAAVDFMFLCQTMIILCIGSNSLLIFSNANLTTTKTK